MSKQKSRPESKKRIVATVDLEFHKQVSRFAKALKVTVQELMVQALITEMQGFDLRVQCRKMQNRLEALQALKAEIVVERNRLRKERKEIASRLGVPDTVGHCVQRITEIEGELQMTADKLSVVEGDRDAMQAERDAYKTARDTFKMRYEASQSELRVVKAKLAAYAEQGFWDRVLRRVPAAVPFAEPQE